jgi:UDP-3-O-[3-hydroxymyristoyl] glucosamine N-acyltransferase
VGPGDGAVDGSTDGTKVMVGTGVTVGRDVVVGAKEGLPDGAPDGPKVKVGKGVIVGSKEGPAEGAVVEGISDGD